MNIWLPLHLRFPSLGKLLNSAALSHVVGRMTFMNMHGSLPHSVVHIIFPISGIISTACHPPPPPPLWWRVQNNKVLPGSAAAPWRLLLPACSKTFCCMISSPQTVLTKTTRKNHHIQNRYIAGWQRNNASFEFRKQEPVNVHEKNIRMNCVSNTVLMNGRNLCKHCSYPLCHLSGV